MSKTYYTVIYQDHGSSHPEVWFETIDIYRSRKHAQAEADDLTKRNQHRPFVTEVFPGRGSEARIECTRRNRMAR